MAKYNIHDKKDVVTANRDAVSPLTMDRLHEKTLNIIVMQKKYRDQSYSAKDLARDIGTNTRYISALMNTRFHMNYTSFVNKYRIDDAMSILEDKSYQDVKIEEVGKMAGFANRMSFYTSFYKFVGKTPREYRMQQFQKSLIENSK